jgi:copper resistance protein C
MRLSLLSALMILLVVLAPRAEAHAFLDHSEPKVGGVTKTAPKEVRLWFTEKLEPSLSKAQVFGSDGKPVLGQKQGSDLRDATILVVTLPGLKPGKYKVVWKVVSVDTHLTSGDFTFQVAP